MKKKKYIFSLSQSELHYIQKLQQLKISISKLQFAWDMVDSNKYLSEKKGKKKLYKKTFQATTDNILFINMGHITGKNVLLMIIIFPCQEMTDTFSAEKSYWSRTP